MLSALFPLPRQEVDLRMARYLLSAILLLHLCVAQADALFESDQVIDITINGPFGKIGSQRDRTQMYPA